MGERPAPPSVAFESARALGDVWALTELWKELGFGALRRVFRRTRHTTDVEALIRVMVLNRLCDPDSKLGVLRWLETVALPEVDVKTITHQQLLRSMDALMDHQAAVAAVVTGLPAPARRSGPVCRLLRPLHDPSRRAHDGRGRCARLRHGQGGADCPPVHARRGADGRWAADLP
jgi:hypothetical protein